MTNQTGEQGNFPSVVSKLEIIHRLYLFAEDAFVAKDSHLNS